MRILAIESSSRFPSVSLLDCNMEVSGDKHQILESLFATSNRQQTQLVSCKSVAYISGNQQSLHTFNSSSQLIPAIENTLKTAKIAPADVDLVAVSKGPGSFTGLRMGLVAAKTFAFAMYCDVVGICVFETLVCQAVDQLSWPEDGANTTKSVHVVTDAGRAEVFVQSFECDGFTFQPLGTPRLARKDSWLSTLSHGDVVTGPGLKLFDDSTLSSFKTIANEFWMPNADSIGKLGFANYSTNGPDDLLNIEPVYSRPSAAEEVAKKKAATKK